MITGECISVQVGSIASKDTMATRRYCATMISVIIVAQHARVVTKVRQRYRGGESEREKKRETIKTIEKKNTERGEREIYIWKRRDKAE